MDVIHKIESDGTSPNVCRCMDLPHFTVTTIMKNSDKIIVIVMPYKSKFQFMLIKIMPVQLQE